MQNNISETELLKIFKDGDKEVFAELVKPYYMQAYKVAYGVLKQHQDAEDATQNAFLKIYKSIDQFKGQSSFKNWLMRIVRNHAIDLYRSNQRTVKIKDTFKDVNKTSNIHINRSGAASVNDMKSELKRLINSISPTYEKVIKLRFVESLSYEEISETLMCSVGTVKSRISRGREQIKMLMAANA